MAFTSSALSDHHHAPPVLSQRGYPITTMSTTADRRFYVYAFFREDGTPYYIGKGQGRRIDSPKGRTFKLPPKDRRKVLVGGLTEPEAFEYEVALIHCLGRKDLGTGCLRNLTDGGEGMSGHVPSPETRAKMSAAASNPSSETRAKISAALQGREHSPEHRAKLSAASTGRLHGPESRARMSAAASNRSAETLAKIGAASAGRLHSPETRARMSAAHAGRKPSPETRAKLSAASRNRSPEHRAKLSAATAAQHAAKRAQREALSGQLSLPLQGGA